MSNKSELRRHLRRQRMHLNAQQRQQAEQAVRRLLRPWLKKGKKVGFYLAVGSELNLHSIVQDALKQGCHLYVPYIEKNQRRLWFTPYPALNQRSRHVMNIPQYEGRKCRLEHLDIVLMPLVGIDARGMRLGQGGGFYDTSLSFTRSGQPLRLGVGFGVQKCDDIPSEPHDEAIDGFVSEQGLTRFSARLQKLGFGAASPT